MSIKQILVVDPEESVQLTNNLQKAGYEVTTARSGEEALSYFRAGNLPDLVLLEVELRGIGGFAVAYAIKQVSKTPIIFMSNVAAPDVKAMAIDYYAEDYLTKPLTYPELLARVQRVLTHW
jgi:DNA-binding response OmpR family regulator